ncbi:winged helix-turn-helix domain-containing protein [Streptomyces sp. NPDC005538]|uniref:winged helix-turn-helix domain-containing protein n=1 Tax=Streptomyces sp. NPDC005538 TaxID=3157043 RepID=UPI0033BD257B
MTAPEQKPAQEELVPELAGGLDSDPGDGHGHDSPGDDRLVDSADAPYLFVAAHLRHQITSGALGPGDRLPSSRELEGQFGHANMTIRRGVDVLRAEGLIYTVHGVGSFVGPRLSGSGPTKATPSTPRRSRERPPGSAGRIRPGETGLSQQLARLAQRVQALEEALWGAEQQP